jgi:hypothetical protein
MYGKDKGKGNKYIKQRVASVGNLIVNTYTKMHGMNNLKYSK